jgi:hypothetical protein
LTGVIAHPYNHRYMTRDTAHQSGNTLPNTEGGNVFRSARPIVRGVTSGHHQGV